MKGIWALNYFKSSHLGNDSALLDFCWWALHNVTLCFYHILINKWKVLVKANIRLYLFVCHNSTDSGQIIFFVFLRNKVANLHIQDDHLNTMQIFLWGMFGHCVNFKGSNDIQTG